MEDNEGKHIDADAATGKDEATGKDAAPKKDAVDAPLENELCAAKSFVRNASSKRAHLSFSFPHALFCAASGFLYALCSQRNMKIHLSAAVLVCIAAFLCNLDASSWIAILLCIGCVFAAECVNTALESIVDLVSPDYHELARRAKDCSAAAVLVFACMSVVVGLVVFVPLLLVFVR